MRLLKIISPQFRWRRVEPTTKDGRTIAVCDLLALTVEADSAAELQEAMHSATILLFRDLARESDLEEFCAARGIKYSIEDIQQDDEIEQQPPSLVLSSSGDALSV